MSRIPTKELTHYLLSGHLSSRGCLRVRDALARSAAAPAGSFSRSQTRWVQTTIVNMADFATELPTRPSHPPPTPNPHVPLRKLLKEKAKAGKADKKAGKKGKKTNADNQTVPGWELTVGIEIHAQLNTSRKMFSPAPNTTATPAAMATEPAGPNTLVAPFDLAIPGTQPVFQPATLIPALRAALALNCDVQPVSRFDRKHYFHWDQPSGYQITQYYSPLAVGGYVDLRARDGIAQLPRAEQEGDGMVRVRIKQVQMEQDTAKTVARPGGVHWLDFNRSGAPLVEIITEPDIHHPATAAAFVRKVQMLLSSADACVVGMEQGGLRADVNVSVRRISGVGDSNNNSERPLGQRTEIKNLFSFRAVEDAIIAERDRQIAILKSGGTVENETRGWSLGSTETRRLRGKEGEVDYRYMPDPDLGPVVVGEDLVRHLETTMGVTPDRELDELVADYGFSERDAMALMLLDGGGRLQFFYRVVDALEERIEREKDESDMAQSTANLEPRILAGNWILHVLGSLTSENNMGSGIRSNDGLGITPVGNAFIRAEDLAAILFLLHSRRILINTAKDLLFAVFNGTMPEEYIAAATTPSGAAGGWIERFVADNNLWFVELSEAEYVELAECVLDTAMEEQPGLLKDFIHAADAAPAGGGSQYPQGKLMFLVGKMMKAGPPGRLDPLAVQRVMRNVVERKVASLRDDS